MAANSRGGMRPNNAGKTPSFIVIGLMVVIAILGFNYWNVSSKNSVLVKELSEMSEKMRIASVKKLSVGKAKRGLVRCEYCRICYLASHPEIFLLCSLSSSLWFGHWCYANQCCSISPCLSCLKNLA